MSEEYPRSQRITRQAEIRRVTRQGTRVRTSNLDVHILASPVGVLRVGIITPKFGHTSVARNRLKRRLRELVRRILLPGNYAYYLMIRARMSAYDCAFANLRQEIEQVASQLGSNTAVHGEPPG